MIRHIKPTKGFTIVELLIVIVVIGVLAAITIIAYNGIQNKAITASLQSGAESNGKLLETYKVATSASGDYPAAIDCSGTPAANTICIKNDNNVTYSYSYSPTSHSFCLQASSTSNNTITPYNYSSKAGGVQAGACTGGWTGVWAGYETTCGVASGTLYCWGLNSSGQLGNNTTVNSPTPVALTTPFDASTVTKVTMGNYHTCALAGGAAYCWGTNGNGQVGNASFAYSQLTPVAVQATTGQALNGKTVTDIGAGVQNTCAVASSQFFCWGKDGNGENGDNGTGGDQYWPVPVYTSGVLSGKSAQKIGTLGYYSSCGIASGAVYCWGANFYNNFGNGTNGTQSTVPVATTMSGALSGKTVTDISQSSYSVCVIASSKAYCWGSTYNGDGTSNASSSPVAVDTSGGDLTSSQTVQAIATNTATSCLLASSQLYCWGQIVPWTKADGSPFGSVNSPTRPVGELGTVKFTSLSSGGADMCGLSTTGYVYCWGTSTHGEIGDSFGVSVNPATYKFAAP